ncbi:MAG: hypothetical protein Q4C45_09100 [Oscillospiraceae bacterium]|nr:hypothetical protein [Oscillospiraceae bacterium]
MNRYRTMVERLPIPEGQAERLKAAVLAAEPKGGRRVYRPRSFGKKALLAALVAAALSVTVGAAAELVPWNAFFQERYGPDAAKTPGAEGVFRNIDAVGVCGDVTLTVRQALGDYRVFYILLDYQLPEDTDLDTVQRAWESGSLSAPDCALYSGFPSAWPDPEDITRASGTELQLRGLLTSLGGYAATSRSQVEGLDRESRTLTVRYSGQFAANPFTRWCGMTLLAGPPEIEADGERISLAEHTAVVSFSPSFDVEVKEGRRQAEDAVYQVEVSCLSIQLRIEGTGEIPSLTELARLLRLRFQDGTETAAESLELPGGSAFSHASGGEGTTYRAAYTIEFESLLDTAQLEAVLIGDLEIPLS